MENWIKNNVPYGLFGDQGDDESHICVDDDETYDETYRGQKRRRREDIPLQIEGHPRMLDLVLEVCVSFLVILPFPSSGQKVAAT